MLRLSAPTRRTFSIAIVAIVVGIVLRVDPLGFETDPDVAFWLLSGGAIVLLIGNLFNKL